MLKWILSIIFLVVATSHSQFIGKFLPSSSNNRFNPRTDVKFFLFTADNGTAGEELEIHNVEQLRRSTFNSSDATRFLVHGWNGDRSSSINLYLRNAYHQHKNPFNVIVVDWGAGAKTSNYKSARDRVPLVGQYLGRFIDYMHIFIGLNFKTTILVGHSLGAHISGIAGKTVSNGRIQCIVGLDPARVFFDLNKPFERLANTDAKYVETIHTNRGNMGFSRPIGHAAFYPNWGAKQLGCGNDWAGACSHARSVRLFEESITVPQGRWFNATRCSGYDDISKKRCLSSGHAAMGGEPLNGYPKKKGVFYVETNDRSPFGLATNY